MADNTNNSDMVTISVSKEDLKTLGKLMIWMTDDWKDMDVTKTDIPEDEIDDAISRWEEICSANLDDVGE